MSEVPKHMYILSKVYWDIVDGLVANNFDPTLAQEIATSVFKEFKPLPKESIREYIIEKEIGK